jgi:gliding motility-associated-like protein
MVPYPIPGGKLDTWEGSSCISDENGNLLFYTDGVNIYNKQHKIMTGGDALMGNKSAYQAAVILQQPKNDSIYYIITADAIENNFANGYRYSIVNIRQDNSNGVATSKNHLLTASATERLTATKHANGVDAWIITNDKSSNTFRAFLLTCNGLQTTPVVSTVGEVLSSTPTQNMGSMKVSRDGKKLCQTIFPDDEPNFFQLFDFDNKTGMISNAMKVAIADNSIFSGDFSPNSQFLYLSNALEGHILQVEAKLPTSTAIEASMVKIPSESGMYGIQLAPDGKIYTVNFKNYLGTINNPDAKGMACDYKDGQVTLNGSAMLALPFVLQELDPDPNYFTFNADNNCAGFVQFSGFTSLAPPLQWEWDFGDGSTSTLQNPSHTYVNTNKSYLVKMKIKSPSICGEVFKSKYVMPNNSVTKADFDVQVVCDSNFVRFENKSIATGSIQYQWSFGDGGTSTLTSPVHQYAADGNYNIKLKLVSGSACTNDSMSKPLKLELVEVNASQDVTVLEGKSVQLNVSGTGTKYTWSPSQWLNKTNGTNPVATPFDDITYVVTGTNDAGCINSDSVRITVQKLQDIYVPTAFTPNNDGLNDQLKPFISYAYNFIDFAVYNRWGERIFYTTEKGKGWNGMVNNLLQPSGAYVWILRAKDAQAATIQKKGSFVLIR